MPALACICTLACGAAVWSQETASEQAALEAFREGAFSRAVTLYGRALTEATEGPHRARLHARIAWLLFADGRSKGVASHLEAALSEDPAFALDREFYTPEFLAIFDAIRRGEPEPGVETPLVPDLEATLDSIEERLADGIDLEGALADVDRLFGAYPQDGRLGRLRARVAERLGAGAGATTGHTKQAMPDGLVGYWSFDEGSGAAAVDQSGAGHTAAVVDAAWVETRLGFGLLIDGEGHVVLPSAPRLDAVQSGSYTISLWFKALSAPRSGSVSDDDQYAIVVKRGYHEGLTYRSDRRFSMQHWLTGDKFQGVFSSSTFDPGVLHHLAGVVDQRAGATLLYVDGRLEASRSWPAGASTRQFGHAPWTVGIANPGAERWRWQAHGIVDELAIWDRVLTGEEVAALAGGS